MSGDHYIIDLHIDGESLPTTSPEMRHERSVAVCDLLKENRFHPLKSLSGPYIVSLSLEDGARMIFDLKRSNGADRGCISMSLKPFRRIIKDYFLICESYHNAIRTATSARIEAMDMGRRGLHNEGSGLLTDSLRHSVKMDFNTSRRMFTLICALHRGQRVIESGGNVM